MTKCKVDYIRINTGDPDDIIQHNVDSLEFVSSSGLLIEGNGVDLMLKFQEETNSWVVLSVQNDVWYADSTGISEVPMKGLE